MKLLLALVLIALISLASGADVGTRENPVPFGTAADLGDGWQIKVLRVVPDATNMVLKEDPFNKQPKLGNQFFIVTVEAKYTGSGASNFNGLFRLRAVGPSALSYSTFENSPGVIPDPLPNSDVFAGGVITGNIGWQIRSSDSDSLLMYDKPLNSIGKFFSLHQNTAAKASSLRQNVGEVGIIKPAPQSATDWNDKGHALLEQEKYNEAIKAFEQAIELNPQFAATWAGKSIALQELGRSTEAVAAFAKAKELGYKGQFRI
jgi:hypothetical protein